MSLPIDPPLSKRFSFWVVGCAAILLGGGLRACATASHANHLAIAWPADHPGAKLDADALRGANCCPHRHAYPCDPDPHARPFSNL